MPVVTTRHSVAQPDSRDLNQATLSPYSTEGRAQAAIELSRTEINAFVQSNFPEDRQTVVMDAVENLLGNRSSIRESDLLIRLNLSLLNQSGNPWQRSNPGAMLSYQDIQVLERLVPARVVAPPLDAVEVVFLEADRDGQLGIRSHNWMVETQVRRNNPQLGENSVITFELGDFRSELAAAQALRKLARVQTDAGIPPFALNVSTHFSDFQRNSLDQIRQQASLEAQVTLENIHQEPQRTQIFNSLGSDKRAFISELQVLAREGVKIHIALGNHNKVNLLAALLKSEPNVIIVGGLDPDNQIAGINSHVADQAEIFAPSTVEVRSGHLTDYSPEARNSNTLVQYVEESEVRDQLRLLGSNCEMVLASAADLNRSRGILRALEKLEVLTMARNSIQRNDLSTLNDLGLYEALRSIGIELNEAALRDQVQYRTSTGQMLAQREQEVLRQFNVKNTEELQSSLSHLALTPAQYQDLFGGPPDPSRFPTDPNRDDDYYLNVTSISNNSEISFDVYESRPNSSGEGILVWIHQGTSFATPDTIRRSSLGEEK
jgi:hypothetical protein